MFRTGYKKSSKLREAFNKKKRAKVGTSGKRRGNVIRWERRWEKEMQAEMVCERQGRRILRRGRIMLD